ncbi:TadE/TadG family type IV pilus assembly protein [Vannielia litorea]|uniref:Flp pilus assembly protein TadG n=1 Tax=Vannielia litorea TaxID=1217970 RepID=A0A1N6FU51_9RHOB|nr:TadE/TadG family type IV pilus assembly protein [Vannielia litorea]SIN98747.1 Flp pilus assembly protein TadG [Vannielia litorea]
MHADRFKGGRLARLAARLRRYRSREDGNATIEFVILFPVFIILFLSCFEVGMLMTRQVMLERALDLSVRGLRLGHWSPPTHQELKESICERAGIIPDCMNSLLIELQPVSKSTWTPLPDQATCSDKSAPVQPVTTFHGGTENEMMLVRACAVMKPFFRSTAYGMRLPLIDGENYALVSTSAFVNEPGAGS